MSGYGNDTICPDRIQKQENLFYTQQILKFSSATIRPRIGEKISGKICGRCGNLTAARRHKTIASHYAPSQCAPPPALPGRTAPCTRSLDRHKAHSPFNHKTEVLLNDFGLCQRGLSSSSPECYRAWLRFAGFAAVLPSRIFLLEDIQFQPIRLSASFIPDRSDLRQSWQAKNAHAAFCLDDSVAAVASRIFPGSLTPRMCSPPFDPPCVRPPGMGHAPAR
jgi:hypothetical protein